MNVQEFSGSIGQFLRGRNEVFVFDIQNTRPTIYRPDPIRPLYELWKAHRQIVLPPNPSLPDSRGGDVLLYNTIAMSRDGNYVFIRTADYDYTVSVDLLHVTRRLYTGDSDVTPKLRAILQSEINGLFAGITQRQYGGILVLQTSSEYRFSDRQHQLLSRRQSGEDDDFADAVFLLICLKDISKKREEKGQQAPLPHLPMAVWLQIFQFLRASMWQSV
jgi:hypothetical protein